LGAHREGLGEASKREVAYALCNDRRTLLWFANQRAVEYHPSLVRADRPDRVTHLVLDLDPPDAGSFKMAVRAAQLVRQVLADVGLKGAVKTSGAKGLHIFVPITADIPATDTAAATRAIAIRAEALDPAIATTAFMKEDRGGKIFVDATRTGGATVVAAFSRYLKYQQSFQVASRGGEAVTVLSGVPVPSSRFCEEHRLAGPACNLSSPRALVG
jgi:DNA ligase D-like protein (predicted polymerase)